MKNDLCYYVKKICNKECSKCLPIEVVGTELSYSEAKDMWSEHSKIFIINSKKIKVKPIKIEVKHTLCDSVVTVYTPKKKVYKNDDFIIAVYEKHRWELLDTIILYDWIGKRLKTNNELTIRISPIPVEEAIHTPESLIRYNDKFYRVVVV